MERKLKYALALPFKVRDVLQSTIMECFHYKGGAGTRIPTCVAMYMYKRNTFSTGKASSQSNIIKRQLCNTDKIECFNYKSDLRKSLCYSDNFNFLLHLQNFITKVLEYKVNFKCACIAICS